MINSESAVILLNLSNALYLFREKVQEAWGFKEYLKWDMFKADPRRKYDYDLACSDVHGCVGQIQSTDVLRPDTLELMVVYNEFDFITDGSILKNRASFKKAPILLAHLYCEQALLEFVMAHVPSPVQAVTDFVPAIVTDKNYQLLHDLSERIFTDYCLGAEEAELCAAYYQSPSLRDIGQSYNAIVEDVAAYLQNLSAGNLDPAFQQAFLQKYQSVNFLSFNLIEVYFPQITAQFEDERTSYIFSQEVKIPLFLAVLFLKQLLLCYCLCSAKAAMVDQK